MINLKKVIQKIVLSAAIFKDGRVLIVQRSKNEKAFPEMWEFPGGKKEDLEYLDKALKREIKEETGLKIKIIMPFNAFGYFLKQDKNIRDIAQINFLARVVGSDKVKLSHEHQSFAWIAEKEINKYKTSAQIRRALKEAFKLICLLQK